MQYFSKRLLIVCKENIFQIIFNFLFSITRQFFSIYQVHILFHGYMTSINEKCPFLIIIVLNMVGCLIFLGSRFKLLVSKSFSVTVNILVSILGKCNYWKKLPLTKMVRLPIIFFCMSYVFW